MFINYRFRLWSWVPSLWLNSTIATGLAQNTYLILIISPKKIIYDLRGMGWYNEYNIGDDVLPNMLERTSLCEAAITIRVFEKVGVIIIVFIIDHHYFDSRTYYYYCVRYYCSNIIIMWFLLDDCSILAGRQWKNINDTVYNALKFGHLMLQRF